MVDIVFVETCHHPSVFQHDMFYTEDQERNTFPTLQTRILISTTHTNPVFTDGVMQRVSFLLIGTENMVRTNLVLSVLRPSVVSFSRPAVQNTVRISV